MIGTRNGLLAVSVIAVALLSMLWSNKQYSSSFGGNIDDLDDFHLLLTEAQKKVQSTAANVLFLVDSSGSISADEFDKEIEFCRQFMQKVNTKGAVSLFASQTKFVTQGFVNRIPSNVERISGSTDLAEGVKESLEHYVGNNAPVVLLILTDGQADDIDEAVEVLDNKAHNVVLRVVVGFGQAKHDYLQRIAAGGLTFRGADIHQIIDMLEKENQNPIKLQLLNFRGSFTSGTDLSTMTYSGTLRNADQLRPTTPDLFLELSESDETDFLKGGFFFKLPKVLQPGESITVTFDVPVRNPARGEISFAQVPSIFAPYFASLQFYDYKPRFITLVGPVRNGKTTFTDIYCYGAKSSRSRNLDVCGNGTTESCTRENALHGKMLPLKIMDTFGIEERDVDTVWSEAYIRCVLKGCCTNTTLSEARGWSQYGMPQCDPTQHKGPDAVIFVLKIVESDPAMMQVLSRIEDVIVRSSDVKRVPIFIAFTFLNKLSSSAKERLREHAVAQIKQAGLKFIDLQRVFFLPTDNNGQTSCEVTKPVFAMLHDAVRVIQSQEPEPLGFHYWLYAQWQLSTWSEVFYTTFSVVVIAAALLAGYVALKPAQQPQNLKPQQQEGGTRKGRHGGGDDDDKNDDDRDPPAAQVTQDARNGVKGSEGEKEEEGLSARTSAATGSANDRQGQGSTKHGSTTPDSGTEETDNGAHEEGQDTTRAATAGKTCDLGMD
ncbi:hypothetical protein PTSG_08226 [Salpingoeca rosetta]|uniref:VWFA domain-containing protein n=1 Tax=Salpingoeca rosetta (strain ATCC 50818 / BSB-021) TaxID=946362 RepID=F2UID0_SALR5|nr:uncharacterized protein PTSG_08226 [Salpingoeca rosetta]EGD76879.1 hypothetical protein PTSG_08226 [Salpingoeca rosetta]|eukprot:XP_004991251.1 hypothetical protein PTSG_08226 [Salpingoeca rosetta]